jgi:hypothetical protein
MAVTVAVKNYNLINDCEDYSQWTDGVPSDVTDFYKEGTQCVGFELWSSGNNDHYISVTEDLSGISHVHFWFMTTVLNELNVTGSGGIQLYLSDGTNTGYWYVGGSDVYAGGWKNFVIDVSAAVDAGIKPTMTAITQLGIRCNLTAGAKKTQSMWLDHIYAGDGLIAYGDDGGGYFDFDDILAADESTTNGWGMLRKIGGVFYTVGSFEFGDSAGTNGCKFNAKSQVLVFEDRPVNASLYALDVVDNGTGVTEFILGAKSGTAGVQGCTIRAEDLAQVSLFSIDGATDTDVDNFKLYGSSFFGGGAVAFPGAGANVEILGCSFESCGQVDPDDASVDGCFFISTLDVDSALLWNESIDIANCSFIANIAGAGIEMPSAVGTPYAYDNLLFSGNTYDVLNSSGSAISVNKNNGSNPTSYEGSLVTFLGTSVTTTITVKDIVTGNPVQYARVFLAASDGTGDFFYKASVTEITSSGSIATVTQTGHGLSTNDWVLIEGANEQEYLGCFQITYISSTQYSYTVPGTPDTPATGTILATETMFNRETDVNGEVDDTREFTNDQPLTGRVRKSTASPLYKSQPFTCIVDTENGVSINVLLVRDD